PRAPHAGEHAAVGHAGGAEHHVARGQFLQLVLAVQVGDAGLGGAALLVIVAEDETPLHLPADAAQGGGGQNALGRAAGADVKVDAGGRIGGVDDPRHVAVGD